MTGKNRRHYHCKALNSLLCADVPLRNYSLTHSQQYNWPMSVHASQAFSTSTVLIRKIYFRERNL